MKQIYLLNIHNISVRANGIKTAANGLKHLTFFRCTVKDKPLIAVKAFDSDPQPC